MQFYKNVTFELLFIILFFWFQEWEVLLLSKLDWDMSSVIASDFVEHIIQRVRQLPLGWNPELIRRHSETLVAMCSAHHSFYALAPSLVAAACVLTTLRPLLEATEVQNPDPDTKRILPSLQNAIDIVEKIIFIDKVYLFYFFIFKVCWKQFTFASSFYRSKTILSRTKWFWTGQKRLGLDNNCLDMVQKVPFTSCGLFFEFHVWDLFCKMMKM